jgi:NADPH:quinone reductase-like Zn-dependent oxidoreductase
MQLLRYLGIKVTAVTNTENLVLARSLGAAEIIDWKKEDFSRTNQRFHAVIDISGKATFGKCKALLLAGGTYISSELGPSWQNIGYALITAIFKMVPFTNGKKVRFPYPPNIMRSIRLLKELVEEGHFTPIIDRVYPFEKIPEAFRYVEKGHKTGNVVITML